MTPINHAIGDVRVLMSTDETRYNERRVRDFPVITCHKGCSSCCYWPLGVSLLEALCILDWLIKARRWTSRLREDLRANSQTVTGLDHDVWKMARIPCPMLKDNACSIYEARPLVCRLTQSVGDPVNCHSHKIDRAPNFVPALGYLTEYYDKLTVIHKRYGLAMITLPLSTALLSAERIMEGEVELHDADQVIHLEYWKAKQ